MQINGMKSNGIKSNGIKSNIFYGIFILIIIFNIFGILAYIFKVIGKNTGSTYINKYTDIEGGYIYKDIVDGKIYKIHEFGASESTTTETFKIGAKETLDYEVIMIGGGGGGGGAYIGGSGGGGGAGEYKRQIIKLLPGDYIIHVGTQGSGGSLPADGTKGGDTYIKSADKNLIICYGGDGGKGTPKTDDITENQASNGGRNGICNNPVTLPNCFTGGYGSTYASGGGAGSNQKGSGGVKIEGNEPIGGNGGNGDRIPYGWGPNGGKDACGGGGGGSTPVAGSDNSYGGNGRYGGGNGFGPRSGSSLGVGGAATSNGSGGGGAAYKKDNSGGTTAKAGGDGGPGLVLIRYRIA